MWHVYIILCEDSSLYTGSTNDLEKRFLAHKNGIGAKYTKSHKPLKLVYQEKLATKSEALKREIESKGWSRQEKIERLMLQLGNVD